MTELQDLEQVTQRKHSIVYAILLFPLGIFWMELVVKLWMFGGISLDGFCYTALFTVSLGTLCTAVSAAFRRRTNRLISLLLMAAVTIWQMVQAACFTVLKTVLSVYSVSGTKDATEFWKVGVRGTWNTMPALLALAVPFVLCILLGRKHTPDRLWGKKQIFSFLLVSVVLYGGAVGAVRCGGSGILSPWSVYTDAFNPELSVSKFGVMTTLRLQLRHALFPKAEEDPEELANELNQLEQAPNIPPELVQEANVLPIDFAALAKQEADTTIQDMHLYFATRTPTLKNEYTGTFAGKNLITVVAEGFSPWAIDPERTPTLYRLSHEGFTFSNYYNPLWWASTSDGEYAACTSLIPKSGILSFAASAENSQYFALGNQLSALGYQTRAYHDHTYTYYQRDRSHPNLGYLFQGVGNGLQLTDTWPESDLEMIQETGPAYIGQPPFHTYYLTVSGHLNYSFEENDMASKHRDSVADLNLSEEAQAYLACQMELELAMQDLMAQLEAAGQLENTVICLTADHYPYGLSDEAMDELAGKTVSNSIERYHSTLMLWSGDQKETVEIDKPCTPLDILPTLSNLFGLSYDSRLLMGKDILSDSPGLVVFSDCSYLTELGHYDSKEDSFTPAAGAAVPQDYPQETLQEVQDMFTYSRKILEENYYTKLGLVPQKATATEQSAPGSVK